MKMLLAAGADVNDAALRPDDRAARPAAAGIGPADTG